MGGMNRATLFLMALSFLAAPMALAQGVFGDDTQMQMIERSDDIIPYLDIAASEILISSTMLRVQTVADAIRRAMVQRGVPVYILTTEMGLNEGASYAKSLALAGAQVRSGFSNLELIIIDRTYVVAGPLIGISLAPIATEPTVIIAGADYANQLTVAFIELFSGAAPFDPLQVR